MPPSTGDQYSISIGGDVSGTVVAGHGNQVEVHAPAEAGPEAAAEAAADAGADAGATQRTTVRDHGTSYTVMRGELNIHHAASGRSPEPEEEN
ncbi:hypothetical protein ASD97_20615 [Streptomyces sp. Root63]|uniref:hypothetical protein n=1 Tax=Streptomyces TaxID=1883 RepID=UPI000702065E|nr:MULTISPECIES: hypothetical protein [unclassified Streptomyces]KQX36601.1 hypothetical protein ASD29_04910 [Streptomyces sp. Root1295]KRA36591.1 hypothetical protein ASD97_20615 [Streptomyces sp. Root63]